MSEFSIFDLPVIDGAHDMVEDLEDIPGVIEDHEFLETVDNTDPDYFEC